LGLPHWRLAAFAVSAWLVLGWVRCLCFCAMPEWRVENVLLCSSWMKSKEISQGEVDYKT
jgi:hypothetical protein